MVFLTPENMKTLEELVGKFRSLIESEAELDEKLDLSGKLGGTIGEAVGLIRLYEEIGNSAAYDWKGKQKRGYDVLIREKGKKPLRVQIKTSAQEEYVFRVIKVANLDRDKIVSEINRKEFGEISKRIREAISQAEADVWLLIHTKRDGHDLYWVEKEDMIELVTRHYENAVNTRNHTTSKKPFHYYIDKNNAYRPHITQKDDGAFLSRYKMPKKTSKQ